MVWNLKILLKIKFHSFLTLGSDGRQHKQCKVLNSETFRMFFLSSSHSENICCSTFPLESHLTSVCKSNDSYSYPISLHSEPNSLDFVGQVFMKFTICVAVLSTVFNYAGRVLAARASLCHIVGETNAWSYFSNQSSESFIFP